MSPHSPSSDRLLVVAILASHFGPPFMFSGVAVALPAMGRDLGAGATALGLVETLFLAGNLAFLLPAGRLADASGRAALFRLGLVGFVVTSLLMTALPWVWAVLALRFAQGMASAAFSATSTALLAELVPLERRGRAFGTSLGIVYTGLTVGPVLAGVLVDLVGWRAVFVFSGLLIASTYALVRARLPATWRPPGDAVHLPSTALVVGAALCLVTGSATIREPAVGGAWLVGGLVLAVAFVLRQRGLARPLLDVRALAANPPLRRALLAQLLLYMNAFTSTFVLSLYMQVSLGHAARVAGLVLALGTLVMAVCAPIAGALADRFAPERLAPIGTAAVLASAAQALLLDRDTGLVQVGALLVTQGVGFALFSSPNMKVIMGAVPPADVGIASALGAKARSIGMISGMLSTAVLISLRLGHDPVEAHPERFVGVVGASFTLLVVAAALALLVGLAPRRPAPPRMIEHR